jgi:hypothetical protein
MGKSSKKGFPKAQGRNKKSKEPRSKKDKLICYEKLIQPVPQNDSDVRDPEIRNPVESPTPVKRKGPWKMRVKLKTPKGAKQSGGLKGARPDRVTDNLFRGRVAGNPAYMNTGWMLNTQSAPGYAYG